MHRPWFRYYPNLFFFTWLCLLLYPVFVSFRFCPQRMSTLHLYQLKLILICFVRSFSYILKAIFIFTITFLNDSVLNNRTEVGSPQYFWKKCLTIPPSIQASKNTTQHPYFPGLWMGFLLTLPSSFSSLESLDSVLSLSFASISTPLGS